MKYPREVPVLEPGQVGRHFLTHDHNRSSPRPCCALGWRNHVFRGNASEGADYDDAFCKAYIKCARANSTPVDSMFPVGGTNDDASSSTRALLVNAAFAALGYVVNQDPAAVKLARKAGYKV